MRGAKPRLVVDNGAVTRAPPAPSWLSDDAKIEWRRVMPALVERKILTRADLAGIENYCVAVGRARDLERRIQASADFEPAMIRACDKAMQTARQIAAEYGLTPVSRSRPTMRESDDDDSLVD